jgi:hypothetical protein
MINTVMSRTRLLGLAGLLVAAVLCVHASVARAAGCRLDHATEQACAVATSTHAGQTASLTLADYEDLSNCDFTPPPDEPGNNGKYVVGAVQVNWGDGTSTTSAMAHTGTGCQGTASEDETGVTEPIIGRHEYRKPGTYAVTVLIIYRRGSGNTYENCATITGGSSYDILSNCVALGGVVTSTVTVTAQLEKVPDLTHDSLTQARAALKRAHLRLGRVVRHGDASHPVVTGQSPHAGKSVPQNTRVALTLN